MAKRRIAVPERTPRAATETAILSDEFRSLSRHRFLRLRVVSGASGLCVSWVRCWLSRPLGGGCLPLPALARLQPNRALRGRGGAVPAASAIRVPACTPHRRTVLPSRAVPARESSGRRRPASQVLLLPPRR